MDILNDATRALEVARVELAEAQLEYDILLQVNADVLPFPLAPTDDGIVSRDGDIFNVGSFADFVERAFGRAAGDNFGVDDTMFLVGDSNPFEGVLGDFGNPNNNNNNDNGNLGSNLGLNLSPGDNSLFEDIFNNPNGNRNNQNTPGNRNNPNNSNNLRNNNDRNNMQRRD